MSARNRRRGPPRRPPHIVRPDWKPRPSRPASRARARVRPSLQPPHQFQHRAQSQTALAGERGGFEQRPLSVAGAGKADTDLVAAEYRVLALGRRVLLIEDLALPAAILRGVAADVVERGVAA